MAKKRMNVEQIIQKLRQAELELARGQTVPQMANQIVASCAAEYSAFGT